MKPFFLSLLVAILYAGPLRSQEPTHAQYLKLYQNSKYIKNWYNGSEGAGMGAITHTPIHKWIIQIYTINVDQTGSAAFVKIADGSIVSCNLAVNENGDGLLSREEQKKVPVGKWPEKANFNGTIIHIGDVFEADGTFVRDGLSLAVIILKKITKLKSTEFLSNKEISAIEDVTGMSIFSQNSFFARFHKGSIFYDPNARFTYGSLIHGSSNEEEFCFFKRTSLIPFAKEAWAFELNSEKLAAEIYAKKSAKIKPQQNQNSSKTNSQNKNQQYGANQEWQPNQSESQQSNNQSIVAPQSGSSQTIRNGQYNTVYNVSSDGTVKDAQYTTIGHIKDNGTIQNAQFYTVGHVENDGTVKNANFYTIGHVKNDGTVQDASYNTVGYVKDDGTVQDSHYNTIGHASGIKTTWTAALLFFF